MEHMSDPVLRKTFFAPLDGPLAASPHLRDCPVFSDAEFLKIDERRWAVGHVQRLTT